MSFEYTRGEEGNKTSKSINRAIDWRLGWPVIARRRVTGHCWSPRYRKLCLRPGLLRGCIGSAREIGLFQRGYLLCSAELVFLRSGMVLYKIYDIGRKVIFSTERFFKLKIVDDK